ncbi:BQ2448_6582 [Microbotryum intermedium]|uniref:BQ2448_6582 protein n=1 Tax=Microbotryum intermedium TaxID=269621 RepID=A0A238FK28_9BASI|nr:BQ2448_6582 [Microbotryum intermedium]
MLQARLGSPLLLGEACQALVHPQNQIRLDLSPERTQRSTSTRPHVRILTSAAAPPAAAGTPTGSDSFTSEHRDFGELVKLEGVELSSTVVVEQVSSTTPVEPFVDAEEAVDDDPPIRIIEAVASQFVEQEPILLRFPKDDVDDQDYARL